MDLNIGKEVAAMKRMTVNELRGKYAEVFGEGTNARHKEWLVRRIAWRMQALAEGDISERARQRAAELANDADLRTTIPKPPKFAPISPEQIKTTTISVATNTVAGKSLGTIEDFHQGRWFRTAAHRGGYCLPIPASRQTVRHGRQAKVAVGGALTLTPLPEKGEGDSGDVPCDRLRPPSSLTPDERFSEIAAILAGGVLRLHVRLAFGQ